MWALGVIAALLTAGTFTFRLRARDRVPPMERHSRALAALRDMSDGQGPDTVDLVPPHEEPTDHVRILDEAPAGSRSARKATARRAATTSRARRSARSRPAVGSAERPVIPIRPLASSGGAAYAGNSTGAPAADAPALDAPVADPPAADAPAPAGAPAPVFPRRPGERPTWVALGGVAHNVRRAWASAALIGAAIVVVIAVLVAAGVNGKGGQPATAKAATTPTRAPTHASTTTLHSVTTTTGAPVAIVDRTTGAGATISVHAPYRLTLSASGTCWVQVTDTSGATLFTATLHAGDRQQIPGAGPIVVRLGYTPAITIAVNDVQLDLGGLAQTANLDFRSA